MTLAFGVIVITISGVYISQQSVSVPAHAIRRSGHDPHH